MTLGKLGMLVLEDGETTVYDAYSNPLQRQDVYSDDRAWGVRNRKMNPDTYATTKSASTLAAIVNGSVVIDPGSIGFNVIPSDAKMLAIKVNGIVVNAGALNAVMGNDADAANVKAKSRKMSQLLGIFPEDEQLAEKYWKALGF